MFEYITSDISWVLPLRSEGLTVFFKAFRMLAHEWFYLMAIAVGYWCWKRETFRDLGVMICVTTLFNIFLKNMFQYPRPEIEYLVPITGYTFPSGDAQVASMMWIFLACVVRRKWFWGLSIGVILGIMASRVYLGVHYPRDVITGVAIGGAMVWGYYKLKRSSIGERFENNKSLFPIVMCVVVGLYLLLTQSYWDRYITSLSGMLLGIAFGEQLFNQFNLGRFIMGKKDKIGVLFIGVCSMLVLRNALGIFVHDSLSVNMANIVSYFILAVHMMFVVPYAYTLIIRRKEMMSMA